MKTILLNIIVLFSIFLTTPVNAQSPVDTDKNNYVVLTSKIPQLTPIFMTARDLAIDDGDKFGDFQVIICGKTIKQLHDKTKIQKYINEAKKAHVTINVCGFSMKKFEVEKNALPEGWKVVKNGILYDFKLQKKGYLNVAL